MGQTVSPLSPFSIPTCHAHHAALSQVPSCPPQHILSTSSYSCLYLSHQQPPISDMLKPSHHHSSSPHDQTISICFSLIHQRHNLSQAAVSTPHKSSCPSMRLHTYVSP